MKRIQFTLILLVTFLFSCSKKSEETPEFYPKPFEINITADTSFKFTIKDTDIPILLDSMTLSVISEDLYSYSQPGKLFVENISITGGTKVEEFIGKKFSINVPRIKFDTESIIYRPFISTRYVTNQLSNGLKMNDPLKNNLILTENNKVIVTDGFTLPIKTENLKTNSGPNGNVFFPIDNRRDLIITKAQFNGNERILAIRKDAQINTKPEIKNYDGKVIPFKETQNFYYIYFYPMTTTTWDDNTAYNGILFYKGKALNNSAKSSNLHSRRSLDQNRVVIMEINATTDFGIKTKSYNNDSFF